MIAPYCIFCQILSGERHSIRVAESPLSVAFMDIQPVNPGHTLVVPRWHVLSFTELNPQEVADLMISAQEVSRGLRAVFPDHDGITLTLADGASAGQEVPHTHLHVIPRQGADGFGWRRFGSPSDREALEQLGQRIRAAITGIS
jgi:histidine triad (HIT) family protein